MKKQEKTFFVENLAEELKSAKSAVLINYSGMDVKTQQEFKKALKEVGAKMIVVKNTLFKLAGKKAKAPEEILTDTVLTGQNALVLAEEDPISPLQILARFAKTHEVPQLKVGIIEGFFQNKEELTKLSKIKGKEEMTSQVMGAIASPLYGLVGTLQGNLQKLVFILSEHTKSQNAN